MCSCSEQRLYSIGAKTFAEILYLYAEKSTAKPCSETAFYASQNIKVTILKKKNGARSAMSELLSKQNPNDNIKTPYPAPQKRRGYIETLDAPALSAEKRLTKQRPVTPTVSPLPAAQSPQTKKASAVSTAQKYTHPPKTDHVQAKPAMSDAAAKKDEPRNKLRRSMAVHGTAMHSTAKIIRVAVIATLLICLCTGIISAMLLSDSDSKEPVSDVTIGTFTESTNAEIEIKSEEVKAEPVAESADFADGGEKLHRVEFTFYKKDSVTCYTAERTVGELIDMLGIQLDENELERTDTSAVITGDTEINVDCVEYGTDSKTVAVAYETRYVDVQNIPRGTTKVYQQGKSGAKTIEYKITYLNGVECDREQTAEYVSTAPTEQIVYRGVGGTVNLGGSTYNYSYYIDCKSTVYTGGGITASGLPATENVIAVDPRVIPLGTRVYIDGIGFRTAADTGGAIKGNFIDIYYNTDNPNFAGYGIRNVKVYIF